MDGDIQGRSCRHTNSCYFTMVALGDEGKPVPVPDVVIESDEDRRRHHAAKLRREFRKEVDERNKAIRAGASGKQSHSTQDEK